MVYAMWYLERGGSGGDTDGDGSDGAGDGDVDGTLMVSTVLEYSSVCHVRATVPARGTLAAPAKLLPLLLT
jgi:hypothetical protein